MQRELPREELAVGAQHHVGGLHGVEVADGRHRERVLVVVERVRAHDRLVDAAVAALPDPAEPVDEEVVADVAPAAGLHVVGVDAAQDRRHLRLGVVVGVDRVVDEAAADRAVAHGALVADALVGTPLGAGEDGRRRDGLARARGLEGEALRAGSRRRRPAASPAGRSRGRRTPCRSSGRRPPSRRRSTSPSPGRPARGRGRREGWRRRCTAFDLHVVDLADEHRLGAGAGPGRLLAAVVGRVLVVVLQVLPVAPLVAGAGAHLQGDLVLLEVLAVLPGHADRGEARDGLRLAGDPRVRGAARDRTTAQAGEAALGAGERHLGHGRRDRPGRHRRRHQLGGHRLAVARGLLPGVTTDDVEGDHAGRGREDDEHDTEGQHLLAEGDETGLKRSHERSHSCVGEGHTRQEFHTSHTSHGRVSE